LIEVSAELKALMRRLKLGQLLDTLPERLALARANRLSHHDFLELLFADGVTRRDRESATRCVKAAHLDPRMQLQAWDEERSRCRCPSCSTCNTSCDSTGAASSRRIGSPTIWRRSRRVASLVISRVCGSRPFS
jgi:hypothetical protein